MRKHSNACYITLSLFALEEILGLQPNTISKVVVYQTRDTIGIVIKTPEPGAVYTDFGSLRTFPVLEGSEFREQCLTLPRKKPSVHISAKPGEPTVMSFDKEIEVILDYSSNGVENQFEKKGIENANKT